MPDPSPEVLDFPLTRRSRPARALGLQAPAPDEIETMPTAAARNSDHGTQVPWRFVVLARPEERAGIGAMARHGAFLAEALGCGADEFVAGFIHNGNEQVVPPDRPRPDIAEITTWR